MRDSSSEVAMVRVEGLGKQVDAGAGALQILADIQLTVEAGQTVAIVGPSGSGKSTLLGLLAGLDTPSTGEVYIAGQALHSLDEDGRARLRQQTIGFVFQAFHLLPGLTALENVMIPLELAGHKQARVQAQDWLTKVGLGERQDHYPQQLSGGEQQRVGIARSFATRPALLLADEPTGNLDQAAGRKIAELLFELNQSYATTLVLVTHDSELAQRCQRRLELRDGRLVGDS